PVTSGCRRRHGGSHGGPAPASSRASRSTRSTRHDGRGPMTAEPVATVAAPPARTERLVAHLRSPLHRNGYALVLSTFSTSGLGALYWALAARRFSLHDVGIGGSVIASM